MKIALASARIVNGDVEKNLAEMERRMIEAAREGAALVCFGEAFLQGFNALSWEFESDRNVAVSTDSEVLGCICAMTEKYRIDVLFGYNELDGEHIYSSCALVADGRIYHNYRRISRGWKEYWKTDVHYLEGNEVVAFGYRGKKCVIGLCGDLWDHPDRFALGEDVLIWPVYVDWTEDEWNNGGRQEYAEQAALCCKNVLYVNSVEAGQAFGGAVYFKDAAAVTELSMNREGLLYVEV